MEIQKIIVHQTSWNRTPNTWYVTCSV